MHREMRATIAFDCARVLSLSRNPQFMTGAPTVQVDRAIGRAARMPLIAFLAAGILLLPFYRYELSPDGISYLSISAEYLAGYWTEAINAYWAPLYSWCITVLLAAHVPAILAAKVVTLGAGALAVLGLTRLSQAVEIDERFRRIFLWVGAVMVLAFVMEANSPDLLFTALLLWYFGLIFNPAYSSSRYSGLLCGALGALAYLAKSYGFFFFSVHFFVFSALLWSMERDRSRRSHILRHFVAGFALFIVISSLWVLALHRKYGTWMLSTTGDFNHRLVGPDAAGYPHLRHLISPGTPHAITAWENPSPSWLPTWSALSSGFNLKHQVRLVYQNAKYLFQFWTYTTPLFAAFLLGYIVVCLDMANAEFEWIYPIFTIALFCAGYLLITVEGRYFWFADLLLLWIALRTLDMIFKRRLPLRPASLLLIAAVVLSFLISPLVTLRAHFLVDRNLYRWSEDLRQSRRLEGRLASCSDWQDSAYVAYLLEMPYYGVPAPEPDADEVARELNPDYHPGIVSGTDQDQIPGILSASQIDYFVMWPNCAPIWPATKETAFKAGDMQLVRLPHANESFQK